MSGKGAVLSSYIGVIAMAGIIFLAGGRLDYGPAWLYLALAVAGTTVVHGLTPRGSDLAAHRARNARSGEAWDRKLMGLYFLLTLVTFVVAGLDSGRYAWSGSLPTAATVTGAMIMLCGQILFALARRENAFFSSLVQIESERAHAVCRTGPYRVVRHPGYLGMLLSIASFPLVLGSCWAFVPVALCVIVLLVRVQLEDRFLQENLTGYREYAAAVKYKIVPHIF